MAGGTLNKESHLMLRTVFDDRPIDQREPCINITQSLAMTVLRHGRPCSSTPLW